MGYDSFMFLFNTFAIVLLIAMTLLLCMATRFKSDSSYVALVIFTTTVPDYIYNVCGYWGWNGLALLMAPIAYSVNLTVMPFMLFLAHRAFNPHYRFRYTKLFHFLPAFVFAGLVIVNIRMMSPEELNLFTVERVAGFRTLLTGVNFLMLSVQLLIYFYLIFSYLRKVKRYIFNNLSQAELSGKVWIPRFISFFGLLMVVAMVGSHFDPLGGFRLFYFINVVAMGFLLYSELETTFAKRYHRKPEQVVVEESVVEEAATEMIPLPETAIRKEDMEPLCRYARQVESYLQSSEAYVNPSLSLKEVAVAVGISSKNLSRAINMVLGKNFFDLVNGFRVEKSKGLLLEKKEKGFTLETIAEQCGFNSRFTFNAAFKKATGLTTSEWIKLSKKG